MTDGDRRDDDDDDERCDARWRYDGDDGRDDGRRDARRCVMMMAMMATRWRRDDDGDGPMMAIDDDGLTM